MKVLIAISAPTWNRSASAREEQMRRAAIGKALRDLGDRFANCGYSNGDVVFERDHFTLSCRVELPAEPAAAA